MTPALLYTYRRCPYAMRARMALLLASVPFDAFEVVLRDKPAHMLEISPKATVPVLQTADGLVLAQSWDIMAWAFSHNDDFGWWHRAQTPDNRLMVALNDGVFKYHLDRYKYPERWAVTDRSIHRDHASEDLLKKLESRLQVQATLGGEKPCATDLAIFPFVRQFAAVDPSWFASQPLPSLRAWLTYFTQTTVFNACMTKIPSQSLTHFFGLGKQLRVAPTDSPPN